MISKRCYLKESSLLGDEAHRLNGLEKSSEPAKDTTKKWSINDNINLANVVLASSTGGQVNMARLYEKSKETVKNECHGEIYENMRHMRSRFWTIESDIKDTEIIEEFLPTKAHMSRAFIRPRSASRVTMIKEMKLPSH